MGDLESNPVSDADILRRKGNYDELWVDVLLQTYRPLYSKKLKEQFNGELNGNEIDDAFQEFPTKQVLRTREAKRKGTKIDDYEPSQGKLCHYYLVALINVGMDWGRKRDGRNRSRETVLLPPGELANKANSNNNQRANGDPVESAIINEIEMAFWNILDKYPFTDPEKVVLIADWNAGGTADSEVLAKQFGVLIAVVSNFIFVLQHVVGLISYGVYNDENEPTLFVRFCASPSVLPSPDICGRKPDAAVNPKGCGPSQP